MNDNGQSRRRFLAGGASLGAAAFAGCTVPGMGGDDSGSASVPSLTSFRGSGPLVEGRPAPGGTSIEDLPDLSGDLALYLGGGEGGIYRSFVDALQEIYPNFNVEVLPGDSASLAQTVVEEVDAGNQRADVFWSIDAGSLAIVANNDAYAALPSDVTGPVADSFVGADGAWVGVAGRARAVPYNTDELSESDVPNKVADFPDSAALGDIGWAPTYGAFKSFITAMRQLRGEDATRSWLNAMQETSITRYPNEYEVSSAVANGSLTSGFANHYYAMRVRSSNPEAPIGLAFTEGDAGALVNVAGALAIQGTEKQELVNLFIRHLLSAEAQEFFATVAYSYPMIPEVEPVGDLPTIDELSPPDFDLAALADVQATNDLLRDTGVLQ